MIKNTIIAAGLLASSATTALAGGIDRSRTDVGLLFEEGNRLKFSYTLVLPSISGKFSPVFGPAAGTSTGDMAETFASFSVGLKQELNDTWSIALLVDTPYGADASYHRGPYNGLQATWNSESVTFLGMYRFAERFSVYGGPRILRSRADITIPATLLGGAQYQGKIDNETDIGAVVGAAYEIPSIALRVALTYQTEIEHNFDSSERFVGTPLTLEGKTKVKLPQAVTLDFQSGVMADTLVFGSVRWSDWSTYDVRPDLFLGQTGQSVAAIEDDVWSFSLGVARRLNDSFSVFVRGGYEPSTGAVVSRLAPTDGRWSAGFGGTYTVGNAKWTAGLEYIDIGSAEDSTGTAFSGGDAVAAGVSVSFGF